MCISVDLPDPDGPGDRHELPGLDVQVRAAERPDRDLADVVGLDEVANGYHGHLVEILSMCVRGGSRTAPDHCC